VNARQRLASYSQILFCPSSNENSIPTLEEQGGESVTDAAGATGDQYCVVGHFHGITPVVTWYLSFMKIA
jgi:hypothetical protein